MALEYASRSSRGSRSYQEDTAIVRAEPGSPGLAAAPQQGNAGQLTAVLADGMGGHVGGALASSTASRSASSLRPRAKTESARIRSRAIRFGRSSPKRSIAQLMASVAATTPKPSAQG